MVAFNTENNARLFFRTWYYDTRPDDITSTHIISIDLDKELHYEMDAQRGIQTTDYADADILINDLLLSNTALGMRHKNKTIKIIKIIPFILGNNINQLKFNKTHTKKNKKVIKKKKTIRL